MFRPFRVDAVVPRRRAIALLCATAILADSACERAVAERSQRGGLASDAATADAALRRALADSTAWPVHGLGYENQRFSRLTQVTTSNVGRLQVAWVYKTGVVDLFEATPIVLDGVMYLTTARNHVIALDARTGAKRWEYRVPIGKTILCCGSHNRGVAVYGGRVFVGTLDARLLALDASTGRVLWDRKIADNTQGYSITSAPQVVDGKVITGVSGGEYGIRGFISARDMVTGDEVWRFYTAFGPEQGGWWGNWDETTAFGDSLHRDIAQEKRDSAKYADAWKTGGVPVWNTMAVDTLRHLLVFSTGNVGPDLDGSVRPGDNLCASCILGVDYRTGKLAWYFQMVPHDRWDLDAASPALLFDARDDSGRVRPMAGEAGKVGWFAVVDRETGRPIRRSDPFTGVVADFPPPPLEGDTVRMTGAFGGSQWSPPAYSPQTGYVYILGLRMPFRYKRRHEERVVGAWWIGGRYYPAEPGPDWGGTFTAVDVNTGRIAWMKEFDKPMVGGALVTAGGVVFVGTADKRLLALDARTGDQLWQYEGRAGFNAPPMTYMLDGTQYIAVGAGGNLLIDSPRGDEILAFTLDGRGRVQTTVTPGDTIAPPAGVSPDSIGAGAGDVLPDSTVRPNTIQRPSPEPPRVPPPAAPDTQPHDFRRRP